MQNIEQLADTETGDVSGVIPEKWREEVEEAARSKRVARNYIRVNRDLVGGGDILHFPKRGTLSGTALSESGVITPQDLTYNTVDLEPTEVGAGVAITKKAVREAQIDIIEDANRELGEALADKEDSDILDELDSGTSNALGTITRLTATKLQEMANYVRKNKYDPDVAFIAPQQHFQLATQDQFIDASKFGGNEVVENGVVAQFAGLDVVVTNNMPDVTYGGTAAHSAVVMDSSRAGVMSIGADVEIETEYKPMERQHEIGAVSEYDVELLNDDATANYDVHD